MANVLIIEDESSIIHALKKALIGHNITIEHNYKHGKSEVKGQDLVITNVWVRQDEVIPDEKYLELVISRARKNHIPIIGMVAHYKHLLKKYHFTWTFDKNHDHWRQIKNKITELLGENT